jgi:hypothetical protein
MTMRTVVRWFVLSLVAVALAYLAVVAVVTEPLSGDFVQAVLLATLIGGAVMAAVRLTLGRSGRQPVVSDPFARDVFSTDTVNISHVRVAGVGGAGLVLAAMAVAAQYQLTAVAVMLGLCGGLIWAAAVILSRRLRHR